MAAPTDPGQVQLIVSFSSMVFPLLTRGLDLKKVVGVRVPKAATKGDLVGYLETALFGHGPREEYELFKHGRGGQWGWDLWVRGPGMQGWRRMRDWEAVGSFAGEGEEGPVMLRGTICFDPEYDDP